MFQGGVTFSWENGGYLDLWGSYPFSPNNNFGKETDITAGWKGEVGGFKLDAAIAHFNIYPVGTIDSSDIIQVFGEVTPKKAWLVGKEATLTPFVRLEVSNSSGRDIKNSPAVYAGVYNNIPLGKNWSLDQKFKVGRQPSLPGLSPGWNGYYKLGVSHTFSNKVTVGVGMERYQPFGLDGGRTGQNVFGVNFGFPLK